MDQQIVHQILLAGPSGFDSLRSSSSSLSSTQKVPSFSEYVQELFNRETQEPEYVLKRAFHDQILETVQHTRNFKAIWEMLLDLHKAIRSLVPNRTDLHSILQDERELPQDDNVMVMLPWVKEAAEALARLESPEQSETTKEWLEMDAATINTGTATESSESFLIVSIQYLIDKTSVCQSEKDDFYLTQVIAPKLYNSGEGLALEREYFRKRFGQNPPITQAFLAPLADLPVDERNALLTSAKARRHLITKFWIENVLFQKYRQTTLPEIFILDVPSIQSIRSTTRTAAAGCALGLHACRAAKCDPEILLKEESKGTPLVQVLNSQRRHASIERYEQSVEDAMVALAQSWSDDPIEDERKGTLRGQTRSVLNGEDPVLKLLDERMQKLFCELGGVEEVENIPIENMQSGRAAPNNVRKESPFVSKARRKFAERGLAFYSLELAKAAELAVKVANLAYELYADEFLDRMIFGLLDRDE